MTNRRNYWYLPFRAGHTPETDWRYGGMTMDAPPAGQMEITEAGERPEPESADEINEGRYWVRITRATAQRYWRCFVVAD